jgi:signal transduction histidine kinase
MIVKFETFDIKLISAQVLVAALIILIGSQFFFVQTPTSIILTGVTLVLALSLGYMLIKSVKLEIERKEQLQNMANNLALANDQLRILDNAKTEFISIASHQLRTPVTAIKGFASLLLEGSYGEVSNGVKGALEKVFVSSERLVNLIEDLLNVSRIESSRLTFIFDNASVEKILKELYESFMLVAKSKKFYLNLKLPETPLPEIKMDAAKIRELISNFIDNALKYTERGGVTVSAEISEFGSVIDENGFVCKGEKAPYGKVVRITVSDTGIGIPKEEIPYLFQKFSRGKDVSRLHVSGTGLGLYVGKAIADAHHGAIWAESDGTGKGSRFIIEIPLAVGL